MAQPIRATAIVDTQEIQEDGKALITMHSAKTNPDLTPTFSLVICLAADHPAAQVLQPDQIVSVEFGVTGGVALSSANVVPSSEAETSDEVALPVATPTNPGAVEWKGSAAVTDPILRNEPLNNPNNVLFKLGAGQGKDNGPAPATADAVPSTRSQYAGDTVGR